jgi:hypothetical protein
VNQHDAVIAIDEEADDMLGYNCYCDEDTVLCALDKDLDMIPGMHYNWEKDNLYYMGELDAIRHFYIQLVTGDSSDNIEGLKEKAPKKRTFKWQPILEMKTEKEMYDYIFEGYALKHCDRAEEMLLENGRLLWIRRYPNQLWEIPQFEESNPTSAVGTHPSEDKESSQTDIEPERVQEHPLSGTESGQAGVQTSG